MMMQKIFLNTLEISIMMSILILVVCMCSPLLEKKYSARLQYFVWLAIMIRLMLPIPFTIPDAPIQIDAGQVWQEPTTWQAPFLSNIALPEDVHSQAETITNGDQNRLWSTASLLKFGTSIWMIGILLFSLYHLLGYFYFVRNNKRWSLEATPEQKILFGKVKADLGIKRAVALRRSTIVKSPMLYGIIQPTVVIPHFDYPETDLYLILKHELTHFKRHDIEVKFVLFLVRALYWFNPFVHLLSKKFNATIEMICDEHVISGKDQVYKKRYMETILHSVEHQTYKSSVFTSNYNGGIKVVKKRFKNISSSSSKKKGLVALGAFVVIFAASSSLIVFGSDGNDTNKTVEEPTTTIGDENALAPAKDTTQKKTDSTDPIIGVYGESKRNATLEKTIIDYFEIPEEDLETTKYYYNYVDLDGDGKDEIFTVVMGPYSSGSGGSTALLLKQKDSGELQLNQALTLIQTPVIISDKMTNGYKEIIVMNSGGGAEGNYVALTATNGKYTSVNDGSVLEGLEGVTGKSIISNDIVKDMDEDKALYLKKAE
ncbi:M56 family metallopeptidase [Sporosarcina oncorhynchi]|uniref:M56 family metallopeptidase n=1 Tax=Sporosarcina oncorhynchi TaxID=3056444 RepID=A0ABZ0L4X9_9BACL|nr:M56 family metallopeptidase [Sporosarcina sp. T2O-4]WOV87215.1 M56 family metallopeptidase [Sporosarcina sp. T2O-4]